MNEDPIRRRLVERGKKIFNAPIEAEPLTFSTKPKNLNENQYQEARALVNDLEDYPHAFVIGCVMDQQIAADRAWLIPYRLCQQIGGFDFGTLCNLSENEIQSCMKGPPSLHRFPNEMSKNLHAAIQLIAKKYESDASHIWDGCPPSAALVYRFLEFRGVGPKIATMATNILVRGFKIRVSDHFSIDISVDVHVRRVFQRLGLIPKQASNEQVIYRARELNPEFPGILDLPAWQIGREWCKPKNPRCSQCFMKRLCPTANSQAR